MGRVTVVMATIPARRVARIPTVTQLEAAGWAPAVVEQDPSRPYGHKSQRATARAAIQAGLATSPSAVLYVEDDIDIDPALYQQVQADTAAGLSVAYWHPAGKHGIRTPTRWHGALAVLLTAAAARRVVTITASKGGIDMDMRHVLDHVHPQALVEHRRLPRYASRGPAIVQSDCYRGPDSHQILSAVWGWLPGRPDRRRITTPDVIAANTSITVTEAAWALEALIRMGSASRHKTVSAWRTKPLPWAAAEPATATQETLC